MDAWRNSHDPKEKAALWQQARQEADGLRLETGMGDAADGKSMLFRDARNVLFTMGPDFQITAARAFVDPSGIALKPMVLFDDLKLGLFLNGERLVLASWGLKPA
ncbi:MAG TPA: hypothetical protein VGM23_10635 [Armatimonadota bacterium]